MGVFWQSMLIGFSIAAPVGPIGLLVIQRTLQRGAGIGLATGLGAAVADGLYGAIGAFGVTSVMKLLHQARVPLALIGAAFLAWLAWRTWTAATAVAAPTAGGVRDAAGAFAGSVVLTLSNPATIFSFIAIFGALASSAQGSPSPWTMIGGVLIGSALWWLFLCALVSHLRERFDARWQHRVNRVSALLLTAFAAWSLAALY